jgi:cytochrome c-type biogenesis protein CcmE
VLAKHDENYMPREVVEALKKSGHWQEGGAPSGIVTPAQPAPGREQGAGAEGPSSKPGFPLSRE